VASVEATAKERTEEKRPARANREQALGIKQAVLPE
jgi:hypothetical protein